MNGSYRYFLLEGWCLCWKWRNWQHWMKALIFSDCKTTWDFSFKFHPCPQVLSRNISASQNSKSKGSAVAQNFISILIFIPSFTYRKSIVFTSCSTFNHSTNLKLLVKILQETFDWLIMSLTWWRIFCETNIGLST